MPLRLTRETEYALKILCQFVALPSKEGRSVGWIAVTAGLPEPFVAKIMQKLVRAGLLHCERGRESGYHLARPAAQITLRRVLESIEGKSLFERCVFGKDPCSDSAPCVLHDRWVAVRTAFVDMAEGTTLASLAEGGAGRMPSQVKHRSANRKGRG